MAICYWQLFNCPGTQPCTEHTGLTCRMVNGFPITADSQISDAISTALEALVANLDGDAQKLADMKARVEAHKVALEQERDDIQRLVNAADSWSDRRDVVTAAEQAEKNADAVRKELLKTAEDMDALASGWQMALAKGTNRLIRPFTDTTGYCSCYDRKKQLLAAIDTHIATQQSIYGSNLAAFASVRSMVIQYYQYAAGGGFGILVTIWVYFGVGSLAALQATLVFLIVIAIALAALLLYVMSLKSNMLAAQRQLALLVLLYYRVQRIPTCVKAPAAMTDAEWLEWFWEQLDKADTHELAPGGKGPAK